MATAQILIIGNEVLSGDVADRNIHFLTRRLTELGTRVRSVRVVPDDDAIIVASIREARRVIDDRLLLTGGIGPTHDDRTRGAVAEALGVSLVRHPEAETRLRAGYGSRLTEAELAMALLPAGARLAPGPQSGVYGFVVEDIYVFPGVPDLLVDVFAAVAAEFSGPIEHRVEILTRRKEGDFAVRLGALAADFPSVAIGSYPTRTDQGWIVRLTVRGPDARLVDDVAAQVREISGAAD